MITINDNDLPITAAEKIISGTKPNDSMPCEEFARAFGISPEETKTCDMFTNEEIKEIADYLMVYYNSHQNGD